MKNTKQHEYVRVTNWIKEITEDSVEFARPNDFVFLNRQHRGVIVWSIRSDGIYVEKGFADSYGLRLADV